MNNSTIKPSPGTDPGSGVPMAQAVVWSSVFIIEAMVIILGNAITISIFSTRKRNKPQHSYLLMINLAVADVLIGALAVPLYVYLAGSFPLKLWVGIESISLHIIFIGLDILLGFASILTLTAISLERFYASSFPLHYKGIRYNTYVTTIASIWGFALATSTACVACLYLLPNGMKLATYISMTLVSLLCLIICVSYVHIWVGLKRRRRDLHHKNSDLDNRLALTLLIVTFSSLATWLPFVIVNFCFVISPFELKEEFVLFSKLLHYGNSVLNPVIYSFRVPGFRKSAKRILSLTAPQRRSRREAADLDISTVDASHCPTLTLKESRNAEEKLFPSKVLE